jgi:2-polyprenyl-6-methoxyphenol hydroxylase-like FAD-dependent oxidoreductase
VRDEQITDVVIIGGGIAGASLGGALAQAGLGVTIIEREARFRDRVRGEGTHAWGVAEAAKLGLLDVLRDAGATELPWWRTYMDRVMPAEPMYIPDVSQHGYGEWSAYHPAMQNALLAHAEACGATILRPAKATGIRSEREPEVVVSANGDDLRIRARLVVGADGRLSGVRNMIGVKTEGDPTDHLVGGCLIRGHHIDGESVHIGARERAFTFTIPRADGTVRTYLIAAPHELEPYRARGTVAAFIRECESLLPEGSFSGSEPAGPLAIYPGTNIWADPVSSDGVVLIGDAAMATDPSFGCGLSLVFRDVRELRDLLLDGDDWQAAIDEFARRHTAYAQSVRCLTVWNSSLSFSTSPDIEARRERFRLARERDPEGGGYANLVQRGPGDGFPTDEAMRRRWLGEDLDG